MGERAQDLKEDGYDVGELPADESALMQSVLNDPEAKYNSADLNVAYKMSVAEYQRLCPYAEALEENWGKPPGAHPLVAGAEAHAPCLGTRSPGTFLLKSQRRHVPRAATKMLTRGRLLFCSMQA